MKKNDSKTLWTAKIDRSKARFKLNNIGIDFANEIDAWTKMEFRYRRQISSLKNNGKLGKREITKDVKSLFYAVREKVD